MRSDDAHAKYRVSDKTVFGRHKSEVCEYHVEDLWKDRQEDEYQKVVVSLNESTYKKNQNPLGRSCIGGHKLPGFMSDSNYRHGIKTSESNEDAKKLIYPLANNSSENILNEPGCQKRRNYNWPLDPATTTFGIKGETGSGRGQSAGVASALQMNTVEASSEKISTRDYNQVFGKSTRQGGTESAADCLGDKGDFSHENDHDIDDLGKSLTPGFRNVETERIFGCPSIRTDIPKYERRSVADEQNYGDDVNAAYLLRPSLFSSLGLDEDEFRKPRTKEYLKKLLTTCGALNDRDAFESIFCQISDPNDCASIESFLTVMRP